MKTVSTKKSARRKPVKTPDGLTIYCGFTRLADPTKIKPHPENTATHPAEQLKLLAEIIRGNGWREPITVSKRSGLVTRGHARLETALAEKWKHVPIDEQPYASAEAELADLVADRRIQEFSNLDDEKLRGLIVKMKAADANLRLTAMDANVIDNILREYQNSLALQMIQPPAGEDGDMIRQVILVYDPSQVKKFGKAIEKLETKRKFESLSELCLSLLRESEASEK